MKRDDHDQQHFTRLAIRSTENRVQVAEKESNRDAETNRNKNPVENSDGRPANDGDRNPDQVRVAVQCPAFEEVGRVAAKIAESEEEYHRYEEGVAIYQSSST